MAVLMPYTCYVHIPKTGGTWTRSVLEELVELRDEAGAFHGLPKLQELQFRTPFTFVRHPATWLRSYYLHRCREQWGRPPHPPGSKPWDTTLDVLDHFYTGPGGFRAFALNVAKEPGTIEQLFGQWIAYFPNLIQIGRIDEDPADFLAWIIGTRELDIPPGYEHGLQELAERIRSIPRKNAALDPEPIPEDVLDALEDSEGGFLARFGYDRRPPGPAEGTGS